MSDVDVALNDEGQQFCNLDEASAIARVPRKGLVVWCGDHKQTPGFFFIWMLHGSTKVVVRAVALLSAKTKLKSQNRRKFVP